MADEETKQVDTDDEQTATTKSDDKSTTTKAKPKSTKTKAPAKPAYEAVMRMTRQNPAFEVIGPSGKRYLFTQAHPYQVVTSEEDAQALQAQDGIELATAGQVERFYS